MALLVAQAALFRASLVEERRMEKEEGEEASLQVALRLARVGETSSSNAAAPSSVHRILTLEFLIRGASTFSEAGGWSWRGREKEEWMRRKCLDELGSSEVLKISFLVTVLFLSTRPFSFLSQILFKTSPGKLWEFKEFFPKAKKLFYMPTVFRFCLGMCNISCILSKLLNSSSSLVILNHVNPATQGVIANLLRDHVITFLITLLENARCTPNNKDTFLPEFRAGAYHTNEGKPPAHLEIQLIAPGILCEPLLTVVVVPRCSSILWSIL